MRFFILVLLFAFGANALDYSHCETKFQDAFYKINGVDALYIANQKSLTIENPGVDAIYNEFLGLYLVKGRPHFQSVNTIYPYRETKAGLFEKGSIVTEVNFTKQCGVRTFAEVEKKSAPFSILSGVCCHILAIANSDSRFIDAKFINDFLKRESLVYGDIGVRFNEKMEVVFINPYYDVSLQLGDRVINYRSICALEDKILFSKVGEHLRLQIARGNQNLQIDAQVYQRFGGGMISDTFLEQFGLQFDADLVIKSVKAGSFAYQKGLKSGDRLLEVERISVKNQEDLKRFLTLNPQSSYSYLFDRDDFQFFIEM